MQSLRSENAMTYNQDLRELLDRSLMKKKQEEERAKTAAKPEKITTVVSTGIPELDFRLEREAELKAKTDFEKGQRENLRRILKSEREGQFGFINGLKRGRDEALQQKMNNANEAYRKEKARKAQVDKDLDEIF